MDHRLSRMIAAQSAVNRRLKELHVGYDPQLVAGLFDTVTAAAGSYGCEVWSTPLLGSWQTLHSCPLQRF